MPNARTPDWEGEVRGLRGAPVPRAGPLPRHQIKWLALTAVGFAGCLLIAVLASAASATGGPEWRWR